MSNANRPHIIIKDEPAAPKVREYPGGGGGGSYPRTNYKNHATKVSKEAHELKATFAKSADQDVSNVYFRVEIPEDFKNKVSTSFGKKIEENLRSSIIGSPSDNIAHLSSSKDSFQDLTQELDKYKTSNKNVGKSKFSVIEHISEIPLEEKISARFSDSFQADEDEGEALVTLFADLSKDDFNSVVDGIKSFLENNKSQLLQVTEGESGTVIKVRSKKKTLEDMAKHFVSIQSLDSVDEIIETSSVQGDTIGDRINVSPNTSKAYACCFDTGVNSDSRFLKDSIIGDEYPFGDPKGQGISHGTFVASRIIYGDSLKDQISLGQLVPDVKVLSVSFNGMDDLGNKVSVKVDDLIKIVRDTVVKWHKQIRTYNLSLACVPSRPGVSPAIRDDIIHTFAAELDTLARKYDVLFVISAGNYPRVGELNPPESYPDYFQREESRIMPPGEAMLALTVGSVAKEEAAGSMAKQNEPSPFTRRGPGFSGYVKPDIATHGGNLGTGWTDLDYLMATGIHEDGTSLAYGNGTSFSAPLVTRLAAKLFELIPRASATLVKALIIHFSRPHETPNIANDKLSKLLGNGLPDPNKLSQSNVHEQTYIYDTELDFREMLKVPFYVPKGLVDRKGKRKLKVTATISFYPEVNALLKSGYCKSHIRTKIVKMNSKGSEADVSYAKCTVFDTERYSTVLKMDQEFDSGISAGEWGIFIAHESRWKLKNPKTKCAVVITIEDPRRDPSIDIYNLIRSEVPNKYKNEITSAIQIKV